MDLKALSPSVLAEVLRHDVAETTRRDAQDLLMLVEHLNLLEHPGFALDAKRISERLTGRLPLLLKVAQVLEEM